MNSPVDPVTPEVACAHDLQNMPGSMSELVDNFLKLAQSLQKRGIVSGPELHYQHRRRSPQVPISGALHTPPAAGSEATREQARQLLHTLLGQATARLHKNLSKGTRSDDSHASQDVLDLKTPHTSSRASAKHRELTSASGRSVAEQQVDNSALRTFDGHAAANAALPPQAHGDPVLLKLYTPFAPGVHERVTIRSAYANRSNRSTSPARSLSHDNALHMLDVTRASIAKDKERKVVASALTQHVHVEQGCSYLGVCTWDRSARRPANADLLRGYRSQHGMSAHGASASPIAVPTWVPGGTHKQTFNKVGAEQANVAVAQKTSTGCAAAGVRTSPLLYATSKSKRERKKKRASSTLTSPPAMCLPSAANALRGQPRCHRAFMSASQSMSSSRASHPPSLRTALQLDLACPRDRLKFDAHIARLQGNKLAWDATRRAPSSSPFSATGKAEVGHTWTAQYVGNREQGKEMRSRTPPSASRWDPCSSLDASHLEHLRSCSQEVELSATGVVECHSDWDDTAASMHSHPHDGAVVEDTETARLSDNNQANDSHLEQPSELGDAAICAQGAVCHALWAQDGCAHEQPMAHQTAPAVHQFTNAVGNQPGFAEPPTVCTRDRVQSAVDDAQCTEADADAQRQVAEAYRAGHRETGPRDSTQHSSRQCHSAPATPSHVQQADPGVDELSVPAASSQLQSVPDGAAVQQHLEQAFALIDFVSLSVEELQRQLHCGAHVCNPEDGTELASLHQQQSALTSGNSRNYTGMRPEFLSEIAGQVPEMESEINAQKATIVGQLGDIRQSMQQLHSAHLQAMHESARSTLAIRTGRISTMAAHLPQ